MNKSDPIALDEFFSKYQILSYAKNQVIIHGDDIPSGVFYIKSGFIKKYAILETGREQTLRIYKQGSYFPVIWAFTNIPNNYFYQTVTPVELQRAPRDIFMEFLKKNSEALFELMKRILISEQELFTNIAQELSGDSYHRVIAALVLSSKRFGGGLKQNKITIELPLTHQEIADLVSLTRETVSLAIGKLEKKKIISYSGRTLIINNLDTLEKESTVFEEEKPTPIIS